MFTFGTYHLKGEALKTSLGYVLNNTSIISLDTANLYKNEAEIGAFLRSNSFDNSEPILITTKLWETKMRSIDIIMKSIHNSVEKMKSGVNARFRVLLHHPALPHVWKALEECVKIGIIHEIGISNHDIPAIRELLSYASIRPSVNQLEVHPFLEPSELQPLLEFCNNEGIPVEAHSVLVRGLYWSNPKLTRAALESKLTQAQYLICWAASQTGVKSVCISSTNSAHLQELLCSPVEKFNVMESLSDVKRFRLYPFLKNNIEDSMYIPIDMKWTTENLTKILLEDISLKKDGYENQVSDVCLMIPSVNSKYSNLAKNIARCAYPSLDDERRFAKFHSLTKPLRVYCYHRYRERELRKQKEGLSICCVTKRVKNFDDQISDAVINPTPMPVDVSEKETLEPFFHYLSSNEPFVGDKEFFKGAVIGERMDMCKQVTGTEHINDLCEAVSKNTQVKHFLLGNNIAFRDDQKQANSMAEIIRSNQAIETWYLAGNYIGPEAIKILCEALKVNTTCKSLWLKRNPVGAEGAKHLSEMLRSNNTLTLLDLDNCGLLDKGVEALCSYNTVNLKHIYIDANGITPTGAREIANWCKMNKNVIKSFYVSINRIGDEGASLICDALMGSTSLKRLSMGSNRLTDAVGGKIVDLALSCKKLISLSLGCYKSTFDLGEKPNFFTNVEPFIRLVKNHANLLYLDLLMNSIPETEIIRLIDTARNLKRETPITIDGFQYGTKPEDKKHLYLNGFSDRKELKFIKHPKKVLHIDSIYRNRM